MRNFWFGVLVGIIICRVVVPVHQTGPQPSAERPSQPTSLADGAMKERSPMVERGGMRRYRHGGPLRCATPTAPRSGPPPPPPTWASPTTRLQFQVDKKRGQRQCDEPAGGTPQEFAATIRKDSAKWAEVVIRSGAKLD
jgi:hypothetical protein